MDLATGKKIGFWASLSITLGSVIGIGIFLKNGSVMKAIAESNGEFNYFNFWGLILSWVIAAIISLFAAYSFSEIATSKQNKSGLAGWVEVLGGVKPGFFTRIVHSGFYYSVLLACLPSIALEGLFKAINNAINGPTATMHFGWVFLAGFCLFIGLTALNFFALKLSSRVQFVGTIIKMFPLALAIVVGLIGVNDSHVIDKGTTGLAPGAFYPTTDMQFFNFSGIITALPAVLFSFDSFLVVGNLANDVKKPERNVPFIALLTIIISSVIYILISIGSGLTGESSVSGILQSFLPDSPKIASTVDIIVNVFITLSAVFVVNAIQMGSLKSCEGLIASKEIMFYKNLENLNDKKENLGTLVLYLIQILFYMLLFGIPAVVMNNDAILDSATNAPILIFFLVYAYTMIIGIKDRYTKKQCKRVKGYVFTASVASVLIIMVFIYVMFYNNIYLAIVNANRVSSSGLFFSNGDAWYTKYDAILFWLMFIWCIAFPVVNYFVIKKQTPVDERMTNKLFKPIKWNSFIKTRKFATK
ncbi:APC family permease [Malacoplasma penetrans]|uniref:Amino acid permease n=1 Tax=Malacoplasma penetrans (strain HF-2) TaxID=272633 RepID=Q8EV75_MALP2|nr:APC family permease [Malacoplasma penetrans]RXY96249.1 APC family permease [Malacoplasma penetrans]BAC44485.1 amino acid permease [Malacoplasma penetrans HF-2]